MSNFVQAAYNPKEKTVRAAHFMDDYFDKHEYGIKFSGDNKVYRTNEVIIPIDAVFVLKEDVGRAAG